MNRDLIPEIPAAPLFDVMPRDGSDEADSELPEPAEFAVDSHGTVMICRGVQRVAILAEDVPRLREFLINCSPIWRHKR
ncbi:MAG: hypothetical protein NVV69_16480 [Methyloversatilis sp.]|jgi:hypothetical protein|uniref:hypothetical protein n=1 Tax=Methyloversatilis sp. TaxID=2569862 RepID=UPI0025FEBFBC|nr:hypothetical protein [Methyloversatilis sp.]MCR6665836.1 hypothetical protein [Methyloversatilis sp.]MCR6667564.1 hypothetical protein [Methyloversatilis sp.]